MPFEKAFSSTSKGYDVGLGKYTRVHRDQAIVNAMRSWMGLGEIADSTYIASKEVVV